MKIRPLHDRVIVRREEEEQTTACLLYTSPSPRDED